MPGGIEGIRGTSDAYALQSVAESSADAATTAASEDIAARRRRKCAFKGTMATGGDASLQTSTASKQSPPWKP